MRAWLAASALAAGCTITQRLVVPPPVVERKDLPAPVPAAIGVRYASGLESAEWSWVYDPGPLLIKTRWVLASGRASMALHDRLLPKIFARVEPVAGAAPSPEGDLDAVLEVELAEFDLSFPMGLGKEPCRARVVHAFALRTPGGEVARWRVEGLGEQPPGFTVCAGEAAALALQALGASFASGLRKVAGFEPWLGGIAPRAPPQDGAPPEPPQEPSPVTPRAPLPPRSLVIAAYGLKAWPAATAGQFDDVGGGLGFGIDFAFKPSPHLAVDFSVERQERDATSAHLSLPPGLFVVPSSRIDLEMTSLGGGARAVLATGPLDLWAGGELLLISSQMRLGGSLLGIPGTIAERERFTLGARVAAGADLALTPDFGLCLRLRWDFGSGDYGDLTNGAISIGGGSVALGAALFWP